MKFEVKDDLKSFQFAESGIVENHMSEGMWELILQGAIAKYNNPLNTRYEDVFIGTTTLRLYDCTIGRFLKEGFRRYDANDVLIEEVPDEELDPAAAPAVLSSIGEGIIFRIFEKESAAADKRCLEIAVDDGESDTYWMDVYFGGSYVGWDRFVGPVEQHGAV